MVNLITTIVCMDLYGDNEENDTFYGDFIVKLVWRLWKTDSKSNYQAISI